MGSFSLAAAPKYHQVAAVFWVWFGARWRSGLFIDLLLLSDRQHGCQSKLTVPLVVTSGSQKNQNYSLWWVLLFLSDVLLAGARAFAIAAAE